MNKTVWLIIIVILAALGYWAYTNTQGDMTNWQTYRNDQYGFEIKYPDGWEVLNNDQENENIDVSLRDKKYDGAFEWPGLRISTIRFNDTEIEQWGVHNASTFDPLKAKEDIVAIQFTMDDKALYATCGLYDEPAIVNDCNTILSTFKFTFLK